ncbi:hypothetical protein [Pseudomonas sp. SMN5]|uniref:hypothetical protein n=1 Tax=Pseudomonas sp. SMN5 TaxID=3390198 RepID=UPI003F82AE87
MGNLSAGAGSKSLWAAMLAAFVQANDMAVQVISCIGDIPRFLYTPNPCESELARDSGVSGYSDVECTAVIASRLAPTGGLWGYGFCFHLKFFVAAGISKVTPPLALGGFERLDFASLKFRNSP